ncbi:MAG TPA: molybdenum cofactor guanylyltransferase [Chthoniobacterales bacterium]
MSSPFSAVLLAGGKSSRMGRDKALIELDGESLWTRQLRILRELAPNELFFAGRRRAESCEEDLIFVDDAQPDSGPLAGLVSAMRRCSSPLLLVLAIDLPLMTSAYLRSVVTRSSGSAGAVPDHQPLAAVYPRAALAPAERCLAAQQLSMQEFARECLEAGLVRQIKVAPAEEYLFTNVNTPDDLRLVSTTR